ncbi:MAG TPA: WXG100 family type VII secretion target [Acidimicrobiales bacterium]|nr:WXG100 family type VII secretion target [Acidimicrobiales bacterium]
MPSEIGVSPDDLQALAGEVHQGAAAIEMMIAELERKIEPLASRWQGAARESFEQLWSQWHEGADHVNQALAAIAELLAKAGLAYAEAERSIAEAFQL